MRNTSPSRTALLILLLLPSLVAGSWATLFQNGGTFPVGQSPHSVAAGDFNKDGAVDLVVANSGQSSVDVLLGNGNGTFQQAVEYKAGGPSPNSVVVGDFNGDGDLDVAVASNTAIAILLGNGDGTFQLPIMAASPGSQFIATADFNHDGILDLVYLNGEVELQLGKGDGTFQPVQSFFLTSALFSLSIADLNGDGNLDLAVILTGDPGYVAVLLGTGTGSFLPGPIKYSAGRYPQSVTVADFNGDGKPDLAISDGQSSNSTTQGSVTIFLGNGDGTFKPFHVDQSIAGNVARTIATSDFDKDGRADLAVVSDETNNVSELLGNGDGSFRKVATWSVGTQPEFLLITDLNGDGIPDLVTADETSDDVTVLLGEAAGSFSGARDIAVGTAPLLTTFPLFGVSGDFNEDGKSDLVATNAKGISIMLAQAGGNFAAPVNYATVATNNPDVAVADLNGDAHLDIVEVNQNPNANDTVSVLLGNGDGTFRAAAKYPVGLNSESVAVADFNRDGIADLVVTNSGNIQLGSVNLLFGNGDGTFQPAITVNNGDPAPFWVITGDFNGDGNQDFIDLGAPGAIVSLGNGDGTFRSSIITPTSPTARFIATADLNGDGKLDLVTADGGLGTVSVFLGNGDGTFQTQTQYTLLGHLVGLVIADFNGDGFLDIVPINGGISVAGSFSILRGKGDGTFTITPGGPVGSDPAAITFGDFNQDGHLDLAIFNVGSDEATILVNTGH